MIWLSILSLVCFFIAVVLGVHVWKTDKENERNGMYDERE